MANLARSEELLELRDRVVSERQIANFRSFIPWQGSPAPGLEYEYHLLLELGTPCLAGFVLDGGWSVVAALRQRKLSSRVGLIT